MANDDSIDVAALQTTLAQAGASWTAGESTVSTLSAEERLLRLGAVPPEDTIGFDERERSAAANAYARGAPAAMPSSVNLANYEHPIRNQGSCGSCVAFGTIATIEGTARLDAKDPNLAVDYSEAHLFYCHAKAEGRNCGNGWWPDKALDALRDKGVVDEACFPYTPGDQNCNVCADADHRTYKINAWKHVGGTDEMKDWLATKGTLVGCLKVYDDFFGYRSGVYRHTTGDFAGGHCISIVGYDDNERAWRGKNSWGTTWGEQGFFRIGYGECGIDSEMWGVELPRQDQGQWLKRKQVSGVWAVAEARNAAAYIAGTGWKAIGGASDSDFLAIFTSVQSARASKTPVDVRIAKDRIVEVYVY
jgi:C1A family cysteine protease